VAPGLFLLCPSVFQTEKSVFRNSRSSAPGIVKQVSQQSADFRNRSPQVVVVALFGRNMPLPKNPVQLYYCTGYRTTEFFPFRPKLRNYFHPSSQSRIMHESDDSSFPTLQVTVFYRVSASVCHSLILSEVMVICSLTPHHLSSWERCEPYCSSSQVQGPLNTVVLSLSGDRSQMACCARDLEPLVLLMMHRVR